MEEDLILDLWEAGLRKKFNKKWLKVSRSPRNLTLARKLFLYCKKNRISPLEYLQFLFRDYFTGKAPIYLTRTLTERAKQAFAEKETRAVPMYQKITRQEREEHNNYVKDRVRGNFPGSEKELEEYLRELGFLK